MRAYVCSAEEERLQGPCVRAPREKLRCVRENCVCPPHKCEFVFQEEAAVYRGEVHPSSPLSPPTPCIPQAAPAWPPPLTPAASSTRRREPSSWEQPLKIHWVTHASSSLGHTNGLSEPEFAGGGNRVGWGQDSSRVTNETVPSRHLPSPSRARSPPSGPPARARPGPPGLASIPTRGCGQWRDPGREGPEDI